MSDDTLKPYDLRCRCSPDAELHDPARGAAPGSWAATGARSGKLTHLEHVPAAPGRRVGLAGLGARPR